MNYQAACELASYRAFNLGRLVSVWLDLDSKLYFVADVGVDIECNARLIKSYR